MEKRGRRSRAEGLLRNPQVIFRSSFYIPPRECGLIGAGVAGGIGGGEEMFSSPRVRPNRCGDGGPQETAELRRKRHGLAGVRMGRIACRLIEQVAAGLADGRQDDVADPAVELLGLGLVAPGDELVEAGL